MNTGANGTNVQSEPKKGVVSMVSAWAISLGCAVGWGAFVMPGSTFLPAAGPVGTAIGMALGAGVMMIIGCNYHFLMHRYGDDGGAYGYVKRLCNHDHGYLCSWFLALAYMALLWANATALALMTRNLFGGCFMWGPHYNLFDFEVYLGETLLSAAVLVVAHFIILFSKRLAARIATILGCVLLAGVVVSFAAVLWKCIAAGAVHGIDFARPAFAPGHSRWAQVLSIVALAPWAYVGFESISHSVEEFNFPVKKSAWLFALSLGASALIYILLALIGAAKPPQGFADWSAYVAHLDDLRGVAGLPVFYVVESVLGSWGFALLCMTIGAAILSSIFGLTVASSHLFGMLARDGMMAKVLNKRNAEGTPVVAQSVVVAVACFIPFVGRTAVGWVVDVASIGAAIVYGYVSYAAIVAARREGRLRAQVLGHVGLVVSVVFFVYFLVPSLWIVRAFSTEAYLILAIWGIIGVAVFRRLYGHDSEHRLGNSVMVWIAMLLLIFYSAQMWSRRNMDAAIDKTFDAISMRYSRVASHSFFDARHDALEHAQTAYASVRVVLVFLTLLIMFSIYSMMSKREKAAAKAKEYFFSTVSHDIRTPLNAIVGFAQMMRAGFKTKEEENEALDSIVVSSETLLRLINDILDLSKLEAGKVYIANEPTDCAKLLREVVIALGVAANKPGLELRLNVDEMPLLLIDPQRLRQIAFNLVGNAVKFTEKGHVEVRAIYSLTGKGTGVFRLDVHDTGCGISDEDLMRITSPYVQVASRVSRHGGTGLGLAIVKELVKAMGGSMTARSKLGKGSTFTITLPHVASEGAELEADNTAIACKSRVMPTKNESAAPQPEAEAQRAEAEAPLANAEEAPRADAPTLEQEDAAEVPEPMPKPVRHRILVVDDSKMNLTVLRALLMRVGTYDIDTAMDGKQALAMLEAPDAPRYDLVLTDMWMPEMDGEGLAKAISLNPALAHLPVYVVTADAEMKDSFTEKGFKGMHLKPVTLDALRATVTHELGNEKT